VRPAPAGRLDGKIAIVTGGGTGLGRAIAIRFSAEGASVVVSGRREAPLREVAGRISSEGGRALAVPADVTENADVTRLVRTTTDAFGRLDVLVNNAGTITSRTNALDATDEDWDRMLEVNLTGVFRASKHALPELIRARGNIVNIASVNGLRGAPARVAYGAAKGGVVILTKSMALDHAAQGVRVNAICPAFVETDLNRNFVAELKRAGRWDALVAKHPLGIGQPDDVAAAAVFLASDEARWITGVALPVDGGMTAAL
jgi:NAD(P)-dependent dehydrogenase (short-subunit alcohol dehydrogenase family)